MAQETAHHTDISFYAATPHLETTRLLFSQWATERSRGGAQLQLSFIAEATADLFAYIDYVVDLHEAEFRWSFTHPGDAQERWDEILHSRGLTVLRPLQIHP